jgi:hypothetical protein
MILARAAQERAMGDTCLGSYRHAREPRAGSG